jgi:hypothetical protein
VSYGQYPASLDESPAADGVPHANYRRAPGRYELGRLATVADIAAVAVLACRSAEMRAAAPQNEPTGRGSSADCVVHVMEQIYGA